MTVFHGLLNALNGLVGRQPAATGDPLAAVVVVGTTVSVALAILVVYGTESFIRHRTPDRSGVRSN